jgi:AraC-like DNA-binding protein
MKEPYYFYEGILKDIENELKSDIRTDVLADKYSISSTHLQRLFKNEFGKNIGSYIRSRKIASSINEIKKTNLNILDIALEYGFGYEQSYIRAFKQQFGLTPGELRETNKSITPDPPLLLFDTHEIINQNDLKYELWQDKQVGNSSMFLKGDGLFKCSWNSINDVNMRAGKLFDETKTYSQFGPIKIDYGFHFDSNNNSCCCINGWTVDPLVEFTIVENYNDVNNSFNDFFKNAVNINGEKYYIYEKTIDNQASVKGIQYFKEYWSFRADKRGKGIVPVSEHF